MPSPSYVPVQANGRPITPSTVAASGVITSGGQLLGADPMPSDHGFETWTHDPYYPASSVIAVNGRIYVVKMPVRRAFTLASLWWSITVGGAGPVAGQNWVGIYDPTGVLLNSVNVDANVAGSGGQEIAMPASLSVGFVWAAFLFNAATPPTLVRGSSFESTPNINLAVNQRRAAVVASGATALPASFDPNTLTTTGCLTFFAALERAA